MMAHAPGTGIMLGAPPPAWCRGPRRGLAGARVATKDQNVANASQIAISRQTTAVTVTQSGLEPLAKSSAER